jgi:hypothetical protein
MTADQSSAFIAVCPLSGRNRQTDQLAAGNCVFFIARGLSRIRSVIHAC